MTGDTDRRGGTRRRSGWDDIMQTGDDDLLVIDDQTKALLDYLGHAPLEDIMEFELNDFLDIMEFELNDFLEDPQAAVVADEEVERPVRGRRR